MTISYLTYNYIVLLCLCNVAMAFYIRNVAKERQGLMIAYVVLLMALGLSDFVGPFLSDPAIRLSLYIFSYFGRAILVWLIVQFLCEDLPDTVQYIMAVMVVFNMGLSILSIETGWVFTAEILADGSVAFQRQPLCVANYIVCVLLLGVLIVNTVKQRGPGYRQKIVILSVFSLECTASAIFDILMGENILFLPAVCISVMVYSLFIDMQARRQKEIEQTYMLKLRQQEVMLNQVQPHFLYNTLGTIRYLIGTDPDQAAETVNDLAKYLRANVHTTKMEEKVPFEKEIDNVKLYVKIEKLRFPEYNVIYDLQDLDFMVPVLTVQPLVENALKHGIRGIENGCVTITSYYKEEVHHIEIVDNGRGFDPNSAEYHVGVQNVKERIELTAGGTLVIDSEIGRGTRMSICIPENGED